MEILAAIQHIWTKKLTFFNLTNIPTKSLLWKELSFYKNNSKSYDLWNHSWPQVMIDNSDHFLEIYNFELKAHTTLKCFCHENPLLSPTTFLPFCFIYFYCSIARIVANKIEEVVITLMFCISFCDK
jgi:hypothetical protein